MPGQTTTEGMLKVDGPRHIDVRWPKGQFCHKGRHFDKNREIELGILTTPSFDARSVDYQTLTLGGADEAHARKHGRSRSHLEDADRDGDLDLVAHFRCGDIHELRYHDLPGLQALTDDGAYLTSGGTTGDAVPSDPGRPGLERRRRPALLVPRNGRGRCDPVPAPGQSRAGRRARAPGASSGATSSTARRAGSPTRATGPTRSATARRMASPAGATTSSSTTPTTRRTPRPTDAGNSPSRRASRTVRSPATTGRASSPPRG